MGNSDGICRKRRETKIERVAARKEGLITSQKERRKNGMYGRPEMKVSCKAIKRKRKEKTWKIDLRICVSSMKRFLKKMFFFLRKE